MSEATKAEERARSGTHEVVGDDVALELAGHSLQRGRHRAVCTQTSESQSQQVDETLSAKFDEPEAILLSTRSSWSGRPSRPRAMAFWRISRSRRARASAWRPPKSDWIMRKGLGVIFGDRL